ncbi:MAG: hypothetical protein J6C15_10555 [Bacteroidaceae bacterium]|nr:hypothetical protein [Bacteroidaceae bacterium]
MKLFLLITSICAISVLFLCIKVLLGKRFVHTHVDGNEALNKKGIHCVQSQDEEARTDNGKRIQERSSK